MMEIQPYQTFCFNPSSNGNGAGICRLWFVLPQHCLRFNPSSNGNGAGIASNQPNKNNDY